MRIGKRSIGEGKQCENRGLIDYTTNWLLKERLQILPIVAQMGVRVLDNAHRGCGTLEGWRLDDHAGTRRIAGCSNGAAWSLGSSPAACSRSPGSPAVGRGS